MEGWVKLHRKMVNWEWYQDTNTFKLFCHFLLIANVADKKWKGIIIKRGQFVRTLANLAVETGLTVDEVRTSIKHLESTNEITRTKSGKNVVFSIVCFERYQEVFHDYPNKVPNQSQINPTLIPQSKEYIKNGKKKENINSASASTESAKDINAFFEDIWKLYPNKKGKGQVSKTAKERLLKVGYEEIARAIDRYKTDLQKDSDWRKPQNGSTFFNSGYVDYLDANYEPLDNVTKVSNNQFNNYSGSADKSVVNEFEKIFDAENSNY